MSDGAGETDGATSERADDGRAASPRWETPVVVPLPASRHCACAVFMSAYFVNPPRSRRRTSVRCRRSAVAGDSIARPAHCESDVS